MEYDSTLCEERHKSMDARLKWVMWLIVVLITILLTAMGFTINASRTADAVSSKQKMIEQRAETVNLLTASEHNRLDREINLARIEASKDLSNAIKTIGYEQRESTTKMISMAEKNTSNLSALQVNVASLTETVNEIKEQRP